MADQIYQLAIQLRQARGEADATAASLAPLQNQALLANVTAAPSTRHIGSLFLALEPLLRDAGLLALEQRARATTFERRPARENAWVSPCSKRSTTASGS